MPICYCYTWNYQPPTFLQTILLICPENERSRQQNNHVKRFRCRSDSLIDFFFAIILILEFVQNRYYLCSPRWTLVSRKELKVCVNEIRQRPLNLLFPVLFRIQVFTRLKVLKTINLFISKQIYKNSKATLMQITHKIF